ncbi:MAG: glycosyltransferase family 4 protein [bacterium]|nr:glycosyltransferase family 4 protein [bacterium]
MKIATNVHRDAFGGITISNLALFDWLADKEDTIVGIEIIIDRHILGQNIFRHYLPSFFSHHIINGIDIIPHHSWEKMGDPRKYWKILVETTKNILRQEAPDVILANGTYHIPWILSQAAKQLGIPIVLRYAGVLQKEVLHKSYFVKKRLLVYEKWQASAATTIIFPSKICKDVVEGEIVGHPVKRSFIIPNPVAKHVTTARRRVGRYTLAAVGRWTQIKNFQAFIALHKNLLAEDWPHRALMVTSFWDEKFGIPETIERKHSMSHNDLLTLYKSIDLLIVPSHFETFCNVAAEALMSGASVLVSKNVGLSEILVKAGLSRMVIDSFNNPTKVTDAVKKLSKTKLTKSEIKKLSTLLSPEDIHERILDVLNKVIIQK